MCDFFISTELTLLFGNFRLKPCSQVTSARAFEFDTTKELIPWQQFKERSHVTKFSLIFPLIISILYSVHLSDWMDPFALKFYCTIQNNIGQNFGDGLNFVTCKQGLKGHKLNFFISQFTFSRTLLSVVFQSKLNSTKWISVNLQTETWNVWCSLLILLQEGPGPERHRGARAMWVCRGALLLVSGFNQYVTSNTVHSLTRKKWRRDVTSSTGS